MTQGNNFCFPSHICDLGRDWQERFISALSIIRWAALIKTEWSISKVTHSHTAGKLAVKSTLVPLQVGLPRWAVLPHSMVAEFQGGSSQERTRQKLYHPLWPNLRSYTVSFPQCLSMPSQLRKPQGPGSTWRSGKVLGKRGYVVAAILGKLHCAVSSHIRRQGHCHSFGRFFKPKIKISSWICLFFSHPCSINQTVVSTRHITHLRSLSLGEPGWWLW